MKGNGQAINESIRIEAYLLSEKAGHPGGMEHYFWTQAEAIVHARATAVAKPVAKRASKPKTTATAKPAATPKTATKVEPKAIAKPKPKAAAKPATNGANGKAHQLSLNGELAAPAPKRATRK